MKRFGFIFVLLVVVTFLASGCGHVTTRAEQLAYQGVNARDQGDIAKYKALIKEAHDLDADDPIIINNRAVVYEMDGDIAAAKAHFQECAQSKRGDKKIGRTDVAGFEGKPIKDLCEYNLKKLESKK
jgi:hypothetical protein